MIASMCYSAMIRQHAKELSIKFGVRVQLDMFDEIFERRKKGEKLTINKLMEQQFLEDPKSALEKHISKSILGYRTDQLVMCETELEKQRQRLEGAKAALEKRITKKSQEEIRIASAKIDQLEFKMKKLKVGELIAEEESSVFPGSYLTMLASDNGEKFIAPFRYLMRPNGQPEGFDQKFSGCYNARRDNLENPFWKPVFGRRHGIILVEKFFEHVSAEDYLRHFSLNEEDRKKKNIILRFAPDTRDLMIVPTLWDINQQKGKPDLYSCALITQEPPPEIAETGHNRCPVFLKEKHVDAWLNPQNRSLAELYEILDDAERPKYQHSLMSA